MTEPLRIGVLGAAAIVPRALIKPARKQPEVKVAAIAARARGRAEEFARQYEIPRVYDTYEEVVCDPNIDALYIPLPNSLHAYWTVKSLRAGKHVLCEKPLAANADEAQAMADAVKETGKVLMEAVHYRYHPLARRVHEIVTGGALGTVQRMELFHCFPVLKRSDIRYRYDLAGGALMDMGSYSVNFSRYLMGTEPTVRFAKARTAAPDVDRWMSTELEFPNQVIARITCSIWSLRLLHAEVRVFGTLGSLKVIRPNTPHLFGKLRWRIGARTFQERPASGMTYDFQLQAFVDAIRRGRPVETSAQDGVRNLRVIDEIYRKAGLPIRGASFRNDHR